MQITRATDYAVRVMVHLAAQTEQTTMTLSEIADAAGAPENFISKILQRLVQRGMVVSNRGRAGGYRLAVSGEEVSLLQVIEVVEGPLQINLCLSRASACDRRSWCAVHPIWNEAQEALKRVLGSVSIARMARESMENVAEIARKSGADVRPLPVQPARGGRLPN